VADRDEEPPFEGGAQPVEEHATGIRGGGRGAMQTVVIVVAVLVVLAALLWFAVPIVTGTR
jgi:hypothetical protein